MKKLISVAAVLAAVGIVAGCFTSAAAYTETKHIDGSVTVSKVKIIGTGDKASQVAAEGLFADGTADDLGAGVKTASASQESSGIEGTLNGLGGLMTGMAQFMAATQGVKTPAVAATQAATTTTAATVPTVTAVASESEPATPVITVASLPTESSTAGYTALAAKIAEAKSSGKPLVVIAGSPACGYCTKFAGVLDADAAFAARTDIVVYREHVAWDSNQALRWTGGGNAPIMRVTQWTNTGAVICDKKVNRPQTVADIEAALSACVAP